MKKCSCILLALALLAGFMPQMVAAKQNAFVSWNFENEQAGDMPNGWYCLRKDEPEEGFSPTDESYYSFYVKNEGENNCIAYKNVNTPNGLVLRYAKNFDEPVNIDENNDLIVAFKVKMTGDSQAASTDVRIFGANTSQQEMLMGFSNDKVRTYTSHNLNVSQKETVFEKDMWHKAEIAILGGEKAMLHFFDGKRITDDPVPLYTYSNGEQFSGPYRNFHFVNWASGNGGTQEIMFDDIKIYRPEKTYAVNFEPINNKTGVNPEKNIKVEYNQYIDENTLFEAKAEINGAAAEVKLLADGKTVEIIPKAKLAEKTAYTVALSGVKDVFGKNVDDVTFNFTTWGEDIYVEKTTVIQTAENTEKDVTNTALSEGFVTAKAVFNNECAKSGTAVGVLALYNQNELIRASVSENVEITENNDKASLSAQMQLSESEAENGTVKFFVFNSMESLEPFGEIWQSKKTYVVSEEGSDGNDGTKAKPFKTLFRAVNAAKAGDRVIIENGEYKEKNAIIFKEGGEDGSPIEICAREKGKAKIVFASSERAKSKINIPKGTSGYIILRGLVITQEEIASEEKGDYVNADILVECRASNCTFKENEIYGCFEDCFKAAYAKGIILENNIFHSSVHEGIDFVCVKDSIVKGNTISEAERVAVMLKGNSKNIQVFRNTVFSDEKKMDTAIALGGSTDATSSEVTAKDVGFEAYNFVCFSNVVYSKTLGNIGCGIMFEGAKDSIAFNNTVSGCKNGISLIQAPGLNKDWEWNPITINPRVYNNIIANSTQNAVYVGETTENVQCDYNLYFNNAASPQNEEHGKTADPLFLNAAAFDFHIKAESPAASGGFALGNVFDGYGDTKITADVSDYDGVKFGESRAIGAYQPK